MGRGEPWGFFLLIISTLFKTACGSAGTSLWFDGHDDYATVFPDFNPLNAWTLEFWVRPSNNQTADGSCVVGLQSLSAKNILTIAVSSKTSWDVVFGPDEQSIPMAAWSGNSIALNGYAQHLTVVHKTVGQLQSRLTLLINGTESAQWFVTATAARSLKEPNLPVLLGACHSAGQTSRKSRQTRGLFRERFFAGDIDEVRWWGRALTSAQAAVSYTWTGLPSRWPAEDFAGVQGVAAISARASALEAQYSFDTVSGAIIYDTSGHGRHGTLGSTDGTSAMPAYDDSSFTNDALYGPVYGAFRESTSSNELLLNTALYFGSTGPSYSGFVVISLPSLVSVYDDDDVALTVGSLATGLTIKVTVGSGFEFDTMSVQPCFGDWDEAPVLSACTDRILDVTFGSIASAQPVAGPNMALSLLKTGGFVQLPSLPRTFTLEFWAQFSTPIEQGATLFSSRERADPDGSLGREILRVWLDVDRDVGVVDVCSASGSALEIVVPGLISTSKQHFALVGEYTSSGTYEFTIYQDSVQVAFGTVTDPCVLFDSDTLLKATLGQRYVAQTGSGSSTPWSQNFLSMSWTDLRLWNYARPEASIADAMSSRMGADTSGLVAYAPVTVDDCTAVAVDNVREVVLTSGITSTGNSTLDLAQSMKVLCSEDEPLCTNVSLSTGFTCLNETYQISPQALTYETAGRTNFKFYLWGVDPDNADEDRDVVRFEIVDFPNKTCGLLYGNGDESYIRGDSNEVVRQDRLPLLFMPFAGATTAQETAMGGSCSTSLSYYAVDSLNRRSARPATINFKVWTETVTITSVKASALSVDQTTEEVFAMLRAAATQNSGSLMNAGGLLQIEFSAATNAPAITAESLFDVVEGTGSWGTSSAEVVWYNGGQSCLIQIDPAAVSLGAKFTPGTTKLQVRRAAFLQLASDGLSAPSEAISPTLVGDFSVAMCSSGYVVNWATGECDPCPAGTYWTKRRSDLPYCVACADGTYSSTEASTECEACAAGTYMPSGAVNRSACLEAPVGTFVPEKEAVKWEPCMSGSVAETEGNFVCEVCPENAECAYEVGNGSATAIASAGFFKYGEDAFVSCRIPQTCLGENTCSSGHASPELGCYACASGYHRGAGAIRDYKECHSCPSLKSGFIGLGVVVVIVLAIAFFFAKLNVTSARRGACLHIFFLRIGMGHLFLMSSFRSLEAWQLEGGFGSTADFLKDLIDVLFVWDGRAPIQLIPIECMLHEYDSGMSTEAKIWITICFWVLLPLVIMLLALLISSLLLELYAAAILAFGSPALIAEITAPMAEEESEGGKEVIVSASEAKQGTLGVTDGNMTSIVPVGEALAPILSDGGMGPGLSMWQAVWSPDHQAYYYYNKEDRVSTWEQPIANPALVAMKSFENLQAQEFGSESEGPNVMSDFLEASLEYRVWGIWRVRWGAPTVERRDAFLDDSSSILICIAELFYVPVLLQLMAFLRCDSLTAGQSGEERLLVYPDLVCDSSSHNRVLIGAWLGILLVGLGVPLLFFWLSERSKSGDFYMRVPFGLLTGAYERRYVFWENLHYLWQFAVAATLMAPGLTPSHRLLLLLACANVAAFMHHDCEPYDNQSGILLDSLESISLRIFCATMAAMLLGVAEVANDTLCFVLVIAAFVAHIVFLLVLLLHIFRHVRRSIADSVVACHMKGNQAGTYAKMVFDWEMKARKKMAHVRFDEKQNAIKVIPGEMDANGKVGDSEQLYIACGLADCLSHAVAECKMERLSMSFVEYIGRQSFAMQFERLQREHDVKKGNVAVRRRPSFNRSQTYHSEDSRTVPTAVISAVDSQAFTLDMLAGDFQSALTEACLKCSREELEEAFHSFMVEKGLGEVGDYYLHPSHRMIKNFETRRCPEKQVILSSITTINPEGASLQVNDLEDAEEQEVQPPTPARVMSTSLKFASPGASNIRSATATPDIPSEGGSRSVTFGELPAGGRHTPGASLGPGASFKSHSRAPSLPGQVDRNEASGSTETFRCRGITVSSWNVLGRQKALVGPDRKASSEPDETTVIVDAADLATILSSPSAAIGETKVLYQWLGIHHDKRFPPAVRSVIQEDLKAKGITYPKCSVIHVAGPDLRDLRYDGQLDETVEALNICYRNILSEFLASGKHILRVVPVCAGAKCGDYLDEMPELVSKALKRAFDETRASHPKAKRLQGSHIEFCVPNPNDYPQYQAALAAEFGA